jgi:hypothetical protein
VDVFYADQDGTRYVYDHSCPVPERFYANDVNC